MEEDLAPVTALVLTGERERLYWEKIRRKKDNVEGQPHDPKDSRRSAEKPIVSHYSPLRRSGNYIRFGETERESLEKRKTQAESKLERPEKVRKLATQDV